MGWRSTWAWVFGWMLSCSIAASASACPIVWRTECLRQELIKRPKKGARGAQFIHVHPWYAFRGAD